MTRAMKVLGRVARSRRLQLVSVAVAGSLLLGGCYVAPLAPARVSGAVIVRPEGGGCWHPGWRGPYGAWHPGHWGVCG
ncbi:MULTISPECIES: hypothetical protein [Thiomonas]|jgi:hypothetical protein|uniref:hypothetical protein n=1 Tax=Thiomonas TaxID=32012 RepID=UPI0007C31FB9|nr:MULTISPECIES: hypothetical protein [Thiomonas]CQR44284.1 conserved exported hypothetical protein [Thiomonas sp. CB3]